MTTGPISMEQLANDPNVGDDFQFRVSVGEVRKALQALADVRTLESWEDGDTDRKVELFRMAGVPQWPWCCACEGVEPGSAYRRTFRGDSRDEARAKAAAWARGLK